MQEIKNNLYNAFENVLSKDLDKTLLVLQNGLELTRRNVVKQSARIANTLESLNAKPGDRISIQTEKVTDSIALYLACLRGGFIYHPLNPDYTSSEVSYFFEDADPTIIICDPKNEDTYKTLFGLPKKIPILTLSNRGKGSLVSRSTSQSTEYRTHACAADSLAALVYSSGTTGKPKGVMLSHNNLISNAKTLIKTWKLSETDCLLHALPIFHVHGLFVGINCCLLTGGSMIFLPRFDSETVIESIPRATLMMGVPTYYHRLLNSGQLSRSKCKKIRLFISGSAPLRIDTFNDFKQATDHEIVERYGMTETLMNTSNPVDHLRKAGSVGLPLEGIATRIVNQTNEVGELEVKGPNVCMGYWRQDKASKQSLTVDGFFRTGDQVKKDGDGYITIVGRKTDLIISGGLNVYPVEVETVINNIEGVLESTVIGISDDDLGETVTAMVVREDDSQLNAEKIIALTKHELASYKVPKAVFFVSKLPRNTMGKIQKDIIKQQFIK